MITAEILKISFFCIFCWTMVGTSSQKGWELLKYGQSRPAFCIYCDWSSLTSKTTQVGTKWGWVNDSIFDWSIIPEHFPWAKPDDWDATNPTEHLLQEAAPLHCPGCRTETPSAGFWWSALVRPEYREQSYCFCPTDGHSHNSF